MSSRSWRITWWNMCIPETFHWGRCPCENELVFAQIMWYFEGLSACKIQKEPVFSVHWQCPKVAKQVSIIHFFLPVKNHIFGMTYVLWHRLHFSLIETQCHLDTTHLWIQPLGRSKIMQHLQHKRAKHFMKIWNSFSCWVIIPALAKILLFTTNFKEK